MRLAHYYRPQALPIDVTYIMTETWHGLSLWAPWQEVVLGTFETIVLPDLTLGMQEFLSRRQSMIAQQVRDWIDKAEARLRVASAPI